MTTIFIFFKEWNKTFKINHNYIYSLKKRLGDFEEVIVCSWHVSKSAVGCPAAGTVIPCSLS